MFHLVIVLLLAGSPVQLGSKAEPSMEVCTAEEAVLLPQLDAAMKAKAGPTAEAKAKCMDAVAYAAFLQSAGMSDPEVKGSEKVN